MVSYANRSTPVLHEILAHERAIRAIARRLLSDAAADDVVQETLLRALRRRPRRARCLRAWLLTVAGNVAKNVVRSEARRTQRERVVARRELVENGDGGERFDRERRVAAAVLELREPYRSTVLLRFYQGWTLTAIARDSGISTTSVRKRLHRAFVLLKASLDETEREPDEPAVRWCLGLPHESPAPG